MSEHKVLKLNFVVDPKHLTNRLCKYNFNKSKGYLLHFYQLCKTCLQVKSRHTIPSKMHHQTTFHKNYMEHIFLYLRLIEDSSQSNVKSKPPSAQFYRYCNVGIRTTNAWLLYWFAFTDRNIMCLIRVTKNTLHYFTNKESFPPHFQTVYVCSRK